MNQKILTGLPVFAVLSCFLPVLFLPKGAWYSPRYFLLSHEVPYWDFTPAFQILRAILRPFSLGILGLHLITLVAVALACGGLAYVQRPAALSSPVAVKFLIGFVSMIYLGVVPEYNHLVFLGFILLVPVFICPGQKTWAAVSSQSVGFAVVALGRPSAAMVLLACLLANHYFAKNPQGLLITSASFVFAALWVFWLNKSLLGLPTHALPISYRLDSCELLQEAMKNLSLNISLRDAYFLERLINLCLEILAVSLLIVLLLWASRIIPALAAPSTYLGLISAFCAWKITYFFMPSIAPPAKIQFLIWYSTETVLLLLLALFFLFRSTGLLKLPQAWLCLVTPLLVSAGTGARAVQIASLFACLPLFFLLRQRPHVLRDSTLAWLSFGLFLMIFSKHLLVYSGFGELRSMSSIQNLSPLSMGMFCSREMKKDLITVKAISQKFQDKRLRVYSNNCFWPYLFQIPAVPFDLENTAPVFRGENKSGAIVFLEKRKSLPNGQTGPSWMAIFLGARHEKINNIQTQNFLKKIKSQNFQLKTTLPLLNGNNLDIFVKNN